MPLYHAHSVLRGFTLSFEKWILFLVSYWLITLIPGPNVIMVLKNVLSHGRRAAYISILGNLVCQCFIVIGVALGLGHLLALSPEWFFILKILGGGYLVYLGLSTIIKSRKTHSHAHRSFPVFTNTNHAAGITSHQTPQILHEISNVSAFVSAFLVSASNPKTIIFLSAFLPQFLDPSASIAPQFVILYCTIALIVVTVHSIYAEAIIRIQMAHQTLNQKSHRRLPSLLSTLQRHIQSVIGGTFIAIGVGVILGKPAR